MSGSWKSLCLVLEALPFLKKQNLINAKSWGHEKEKGKVGLKNIMQLEYYVTKSKIQMANIWKTPSQTNSEYKKKRYPNSNCL